MQDWPHLPPNAVDSIGIKEEDAGDQLHARVQPYSPENPAFIFERSEMNAAGAKVIEYIAEYARDLVDAAGEQYLQYAPEAMMDDEGVLDTKVRLEVKARADRQWTLWETMVDSALQARWSPEYYRAYVAEGNQPGSPEQQQLELYRLHIDAAVNSRIAHWRGQASRQVTPGTTTPVVPAEDADEAEHATETLGEKVNDSPHYLPQQGCPP
jgi:hypothetical protein